MVGTMSHANFQVEEYHLKYNANVKSILAEDVNEGQIILNVEGASGIEVLEARIKYEGFDDFSEWGKIRNMVSNLQMVERKRLVYPTTDSHQNSRTQTWPIH